MDKLTEVLSQSPAGVDEDTIKNIFAKNKENVLDTLMELWDMPPKLDKQKSKWEDIRETCDAYDMEMDRLVMSQLRNQTPPQQP